ncbi:hypothetical protein F4677DRAFT_162903 [Hypoxylon crocopeplum]|nr:hypothetical protein F4677DRAFT_162903 [Hypoxylon crocopeplum]
MAHRRHRSRRRLFSLLPLLAIASTTSALNLSQFQVITSNQIPKDCIRAYQTDIDGCKRKDFTKGRQCSSSCVEGLEETANLINEECGDLNVSPKSLLGIVLSGGLIDALCPGLQATTVTKTVQPTTPDGFTTVKPSPTTTSDDMTTKTTEKTSETHATTSPKTSQTSPTSDSSTTTASTIASTTGQETTSPTSTNDLSTSSISSTDATSVQTTAQPAVTSEPTQTSTSDDAPTPFIGGSPFDPAPIQNVGAVLRSGYDTIALAAAIYGAAFILR